MKKIDCHTHIINEQIRKEYFSRTDGYAFVMQFPESILANPDTVRTVQSDPRLFLCPCIDLKQDIRLQLQAIEAHLADWKVVGLKIYTSYQKGRATDETLQPVYVFAAEHKLSVTFHTGLCSLVLPSDEDLEGSGAAYIAKAAEKWPEVNFIAAHMDDPNLDACCELCAAHPNLFTDCSGLFEPGYEDDWNKLAAAYGGAIRRASCASQILYGTDFCPPLNLTDIERFDAFLEAILPSEALENTYYHNALRAFPRLAEHLKNHPHETD